MSRSYKKNWIYKENSNHVNDRRKINSSKKRAKLKSLDYEDTPKLISKRMSSVYGIDNWDFSDYTFHEKYKSESIDYAVLRNIYGGKTFFKGDYSDLNFEIKEEKLYIKNKSKYLYENYYWSYKK